MSWIEYIILGIFIILPICLLLVFAYVECGKSVIDFWKDTVEPKVLKTSKWRSLVRGVIFVLNPLVWIVFIILGILILLLNTYKNFVEAIYEINWWLHSTYKEVKELITK